MEAVVARLLQDFEAGRITRRQLIQSLAMACTAAYAGTAAPVAAAGGFKTVAVDHISYQVADYKRSRDFYVDLLGMTVSREYANFSTCELTFGDSMLVVRNRPAEPQQPAAPKVDHLSFRIEGWDTDRVKRELERRGFTPRLDTGGPLAPANYASFHVEDPDGFDLQISGVVKPGDSLYKKPGA
jgi:catechol 2,3-dioxygenase-like lactoylglutathione lyase family enzyme